MTATLLTVEKLIAVLRRVQTTSVDMPGAGPGGMDWSAEAIEPDCLIAELEKLLPSVPDAEGG